MSCDKKLFPSPQPAQRGQGNPQIRRDVAQLHPLRHVGKLLAEGRVAFGGGQGEAFLVRAVEAAVLVLVDDAAPVGQLQVGAEQSLQVVQADAVGFGLLQGFHEFLAGLVVIQFVHAEDDAAFGGEGRGDFLAVHQPVGARQAPFDEEGGSRAAPLAHQQRFLGEAAGRKAGGQGTFRLGRERDKGMDVSQDVFHKAVSTFVQK